MDFSIIRKETTGSTNEDAFLLAAEGALEGTVVTAKRQTNARGRRGRTWEASEETNLYFSLLLRPQFDFSFAPMTTLLMALAVQKATGGQIKWPNDIVLSGKKVCGILTEFHVSGADAGALVIGVGINVGRQTFSEALKNTATSLCNETGREWDISMLLSQVLNTFGTMYERFGRMDCPNLDFIREEYENALVNKGERVRVLDPQGEYEGIAEGITKTGELVVTNDSNERKEVYAGEVSVRGIYGYV